MEIVMINETNDTSADVYQSDFKQIAARACSILHKDKPYTMSVIFVTPEKIHEINAMYRHIDRPTDVISFAMQDDMSNVLIEEEEEELGDIFINVQAIRDQAREYGHSQRREACFLFCHGLLHLFGYDHMTPEDEKVMFALQDEILDEVASREV
ncbi:rRNA maturation RNase YbeY [uncultured Dubosiella sp.]|uniref:rRNA maturation RNase YbeY n=1 Tax=uncultured Dubosiella sp. TaxID=1937011 RepID=UPI00263A98C6|nr:rRNA maturation RNase YbeY [uncultured Dubosiella sp.]